MTAFNFQSANTGKLRRLFRTRGLSARKARLFMVSACRLDAVASAHPDCAALIALAERTADEDGLEAELARNRGALERWCRLQPAIIGVQPNDKRWIRIWGAYNAATPTPSKVTYGFLTDSDYRPLLAEILGPRPGLTAFVPSWRTDTATAIARQMYESRDFSAMPILADALQDAGCDSDDIMTHCRSPEQVHVRGCWVADLVLGKE